MINVKLITVGSLKEPYLREAAAEYAKRLSAFCRFECTELKEARVRDEGSETSEHAALEDEAERILAAIPPRACKIALCIEGRELDSPSLAELIGRAADTAGSICFIIGSSHGLSERVKAACDMRLSVSRMTFPHQLFRVMLLEQIYRSFNIIKGTRYHK